MEDEDIAPNTQVPTADQVGTYGQQVVPVHFDGILCTGATFCPYRLDQL